MSKDGDGSRRTGQAKNHPPVLAAEAPRSGAVVPPPHEYSIQKTVPSGRLGVRGPGVKALERRRIVQAWLTALGFVHVLILGAGSDRDGDFRSRRLA